MSKAPSFLLSYLSIIIVCCREESNQSVVVIELLTRPALTVLGKVGDTEEAQKGYD